jgi:hypothetical protein
VAPLLDRRKGNKSWKKMRDKNTTYRVANLYCHISYVMFGGKAPQESSMNGPDLFIPEFDAVVEVKAGDSEHRLRIGTEQLKKNKGLALFPHSHCFYLLFCYTTRDPKKWWDRRKRSWRRRSLLHQCQTVAEVYKLLASSITHVYLLDVSVIEGFQQKLGASPGRFVGEETRKSYTLELLRSHLLPFQNGNASQTLRGLGFDPRRWAVATHQVEMSFTIIPQALSSRFQITTVLPGNFYPQFIQHMKKQPDVQFATIGG